MKYQKGFKYWIKEAECFQTEIKGYHLMDRFVSLYKNGKLYIKKGFASDGGTFVKDTKKNIKGFFKHDALCYLTKTRRLPLTKEIIKMAGLEMYKQHVKDGVWKSFARVYMWGGNKGMAKYGRPENKPKVYEC